jgi:hypothetical protein
MYNITDFENNQVLTIEEKTFNNDTSLTFFGRHSDYGQLMNQNMLHLMEHFASSEANQPPKEKRVVGQIWFNKDKKSLNLWNGTKWIGILIGGVKTLVWDKLSFTQTIDGINSSYKDKIAISSDNCIFKNTISNTDYTILFLPTGLTEKITKDPNKNILYLEISGSQLKTIPTKQIKVSFKSSAFTNIEDITTVANISQSITLPSAPVVNNLPTGTVSLSGNNSVDSILTATNDIHDVDGYDKTFTAPKYEWYINDVKISNAGDTYKILKTDAGKTIKVRAYYVDGLGKTEELISNSILIATLPVPSLTWSTITPFKELTDNSGIFEGEISITLTDCKIKSDFNFANNNAVSFNNAKDSDGNTVTMSDVIITNDASLSTDTLLRLKIKATSSQPDLNLTSTLSVNADMIDTIGISSSSTIINITMLKATELSWIFDMVENDINDGSFAGTIKVSIINGEFIPKTLTNDVTSLILSTVKDGVADLIVESFKVSGTITTSLMDLTISGKLDKIDNDISIGTFTLKSGIIKYSLVDYVYDNTSEFIKRFIPLTNNQPTGKITIVGTGEINKNLTITNTLADLDVLGPFSYQWLLDGVAISGATLDNYTPTDITMIDKLISVKVSYTDGAKFEESVTSLQIPIIAESLIMSDIEWTVTKALKETAANDGTIEGTITVKIPTGFKFGSLPKVTLSVTDLGVIPTVVRTSDTLLTINFDDMVAEKYKSTDVPITLTLVDDIIIPSGKGINVGTYESGNLNIDMNELLNNNPATGNVTIDYTSLEVGNTLTANTSALTDADGLGTFSYQWMKNGTDISGETSSTYTSTTVGDSISIKVSFTDVKGNAESKTSSEVTIKMVQYTVVATGPVGGYMREGDFIFVHDGLGMGIYKFPYDRTKPHYAVDVIPITSSAGVELSVPNLVGDIVYKNGSGYLLTVSPAVSMVKTNTNDYDAISGLDYTHDVPIQHWYFGNSTYVAIGLDSTDANQGIAVAASGWGGGGLFLPAGTTNSSFHQSALIGCVYDQTNSIWFVYHGYEYWSSTGQKNTYVPDFVNNTNTYRINPGASNFIGFIFDNGLVGVFAD